MHRVRCRRRRDDDLDVIVRQSANAGRIAFDEARPPVAEEIETQEGIKSA
jgi:hypothetical protein